MRTVIRAALVAAICLCGTRASAQLVRSVPSVQTATLTGWTSATALNTTQTIFGPGDSGFDAVVVHLVQTSTLTVGAITYEVSYDNTNWITIPADAVLDPTSTTYAQIALPYTLQASTNKAFLILGKGFQGLRIKLSTAITGTATVTPNLVFIPYEAIGYVVALSPTAANLQTTATLAAGSALAGEVVPVSTATTTDTPLTSYTAAAASTNSTSVKGGAGNVYGIRVFNTTSTIYYLRMYNSSSAPTCSSATGFIETIPIPHAAGAGGGAVIAQANGQSYTTGIGFCVTGGSSSTDNTNAATGVFVTILYK